MEKANLKIKMVQQKLVDKTKPLLPASILTRIT